jgi:hypothetical protein
MAFRTLELANKAYFLYLKQPAAAEQAKLLRMVLSNCSVDAGSVYPTYRKPFDLIFQYERKMKNGAPGGIRTPDPLLRRQTLFPTELRAHP